MTLTAVTVDQSEKAAVRAAAAGSVDAIGRLYQLHASAVFTLAYRMTGSRADAEDVLQDVFVGLSAALRSYREQGRFVSWLKRVTVRTALMRMRTDRRRREVSLTDADAEPAATRPVEWIAVENAVLRLPAALRTVFVLKELEGYSHPEIAELLEITPGAAMTRLSRAWQQLRKELAAS
jgi:RNA polymerase sigma-70 factor (ECF subfamily)